MVGLCIPELMDGLNRSNDFVLGIKVLLHSLLDFLSDGLLVVVVNKHSRSVLVANVGSLLVHRRRVMHAEEELDKGIVAHNLGIIRELQRLGICC